jgi:hypothetical protein
LKESETMMKEIEYFYAKGNASSSGNEMMPDGVTKDYYYAICRAQEASEIEDYNSTPREKGFTLYFDPKEYHFSHPIELVRCMHLLGNGGTKSGTVFTFPKDSPGIIVHSNASYQNPLYVDLSKFSKLGTYSFNPHPDVFPGEDGKKYPFSGNLIDTFDDGIRVLIWETYQSAEGSIIENIWIRCADTPSELDGNVELVYSVNYGNTRVINPYETGYSPDLRSHGIISYTIVYIRNVTIERFYCHGVYLYGHASSRPSGSIKGNSTQYSGRKHVSAIADFSVVENSFISSCGGNAIHLFGSDAAYCKISNLNESANGGWTIADFSRLGNIISGCNSNAATKTIRNVDGSIKSFVGGAYLRPLKVELSLFDDNDYVKDIIGKWWRNVVDAAGTTIDSVRYSAYLSEIKNTDKIVVLQNTVFLNSYADGGFSYISATNIVIGGSIQNFGTAGKIYGEETLLFTNGLKAYGFQYQLDPLDDVPKQDFTITTIGGISGGSVIPNSSHLSLEFDFSSTNKQDVTFPGLGYRLYYQNTFLECEIYNRSDLMPFKGWWEFVNFQGGANYSNCPIRLSNVNSDVGTGQIWFENGFYIGEVELNQRVKVITGQKIPIIQENPGKGEWKRENDANGNILKIFRTFVNKGNKIVTEVLKVGDRILNTDPDPTDLNPNLLENKSYAGWILTKVGWKPYGKIEM